MDVRRISLRHRYGAPPSLVLLLALALGSTPLGCSPTVQEQPAAGPAGTGPAAPPPPPVATTPPTQSAPPGAAPTSPAPPSAADQDKTADTIPTPFVSPLSQDELDAGWISLFDGDTTYGWRAATQANWKVDDGAITVSAGEAGLLCTQVPWSNYELQVDFRFAPGTNSGIFLHSPLIPRDPQRDCYELNIAEPAVSPFPTGSLVGRAKAAESAAQAAPDTWHHYDITVDGPQVVVKLNGQPALEYTDPQTLGRGFIGLQLNKGAVAFKGIKLRPLGLKELFNGRDLSGWRQYPEMKSRFTVTAQGELHVQDGRGQLETEAQFGDFVVQLDCRTNAPRLNSGLFFRCVPGGEMLGYESQIHNGFQGGDRTKPVDCGTGGIFRRTQARLVAADDLTWFTKTIVAVGPDVAVWVNGYQVTQWTDERPPDENPRKGLRLAAGTFQLQGHDPTTDILFRDLRAVELTPRRTD